MEKEVMIFHPEKGMIKISSKQYSEITLKDINKPWSQTNSKIPNGVTVWTCCDDLNEGTFGQPILPICPHREMLKFNAVKVLYINLFHILQELSPKIEMHENFEVLVLHITSHSADDDRYLLGLFTNDQTIPTEQYDQKWFPLIYFNICCVGHGIMELPIKCSDFGQKIKESIKQKFLDQIHTQTELFADLQILQCSCKSFPQWYIDKKEDFDNVIYNYATDLKGVPLTPEQKTKARETVQKNHVSDRHKDDRDTLQKDSRENILPVQQN